jgi:hypothetical protein
MISGKSDEDAVNAEGRVGSVAALVAELEAAGLDHRAALKKAARSLGMTRDEAYRRLIVERGSN